MIIKAVNDNIYNTEAKHIAFAINTEGLNDLGFAGKVSENWNDLKKCGKNRIGTVISKEINDKMFHALVCHSLNEGWDDNQAYNIKECFDNIPANGEQVATVAIGTGNIGKRDGADFAKIICGMHDSEQKVIFYGEYTLEELMDIYDNEKLKTIEKRLI